MPGVTVGIGLGDLTKHLTICAEQMALLTDQCSVDRSTVHAGAEEDTLSVVSQVLHEDLESVLGGARIVKRHLARDRIKVDQSRKLLQIRCRCLLESSENANIPVILLIQWLGHVAHDEQRRR